MSVFNPGEKAANKLNNKNGGFDPRFLYPNNYKNVDFLFRKMLKSKKTSF